MSSSARAFLLVSTLYLQVRGENATALAISLNWINSAFAGDPGETRHWPALEPLVSTRVGLFTTRTNLTGQAGPARV